MPCAAQPSRNATAKLEHNAGQRVSSRIEKCTKGFDMKITLCGPLALAFVVSSFVPAVAADYRTSECMTGRFREPLCKVKHVYGTRTVVIDEREPDVIFLPHEPYVVVTTRHD